MNINEIKIVCITVGGDYRRMYHTILSKGRSDHDPALHFKDRGLDVTFYPGIHAERLGLRTIHPYEVDAPGSGFNMGAGPVGCWLSHRTLWAALLLLPHETFFVLEDDAIFPPDWKPRLERNLAALPPDWDVLYVGSCCAADKPKEHVAEEVYDLRYPVCLHGYLVRKKALPILIETTDAARCYAPIDISMAFHSLPHLRTFTMLPRLLEQFETELSQ